MDTFDELLAPDRSAAHRAAIRAFRPRRALPAVLTATALTATGALVAASILSALLGDPIVGPDLAARADRLTRGLRWSDPAALAAAGGLTLAGLLLVLPAVLPGRSRALPLSGDDPAVAAGLSRRGLRVALCAAALDVPGVTEVRVRLRRWPRRRVVVHAATRYRNPHALQDQVTDAVQRRLDGLELVRAPRVRVRLGRRTA